MADEGDQVPMESQSNAGKWILIVLAILVVAASAYAQWAAHEALVKTANDLSASQAQINLLQNRMQTEEAQQETLARQAGMTKKELVQRTAELQAQQKAAEARLEQEQKAQINAVTGQFSGEISGVKTDVG